METTIEDLVKRLERLEKLIEKLTGESETATGDPLLSTQAAAAYLHLSCSRIYALIYEGKLNPLQKRKRGRILFEKTELNRYLMAHAP